MNRTLLNEQNESSVITFAERPGVEFRISEKEIGRGASCIVYHAVGSDNTEHLLKEYYPKHLELTRDGSGQIVVPEDKKELFEQGLLLFRTGCERQKSIRLSNEGLKNFTCNVQGYYAANGTEYIDMTCFNGQTYDHVQEKSVYNLMLRMRTLAQVVGNYHKASLLHLDIKPENIYVRPEGETIEDVMLFDFDSVTPMNEIITSKALSCTKTWAAPEQFLPEKRKSICPATDLFAIGEIIFVQLFGRHSTNAERRSFVTKYAYDHNAVIFKDMNPKVFSLLDELLCHTICGVVDKRYQSAEELIAKLDEIIKIANPEAPYLKSSPLTLQDFFVGRENEINEIHQKLSENNILFLNGIGGIGKSELAKHYAKLHKENSDFDTVIFAPYVSDVKMLLKDDTAIPLYNFTQYPEEKPEEYCVRKLRKLQELCNERTLFIVDNLDREDDPDLNKLLDLGCKLLITTRMDFSDYGYGQQLALDALGSREKVNEIFAHYYTKPLSDADKNCVEQIIDIVGGHTMTVELLAKQMMAGRVTPEKMLTKLQEGGISESGKEKVRMSKDGNLSAQSAYDHIKVLFDLSDLNEDEKYILANLSLIPYTGIPAELFHDWCELEDYDTLNSLAVQGWVRWDRERDYVALHPVISDTAIYSCTDYCIWDTLLEHYSDAVLGWRTLSMESKVDVGSCSYRIVTIFERNEIISESVVYILWFISQLFCQDFYDHKSAFKAISAAKEKLNSLEDFDYVDSLNLLGDYGVVCDCMGEISQDSCWHSKAIATYNSILANARCSEAGTSFLAIIQQNVACAYDNIDDFENAVKHYDEAIRLRRTMVEKDNSEGNNLELSLIYNNLGIMYYKRKTYDTAIEYYHQALTIASPYGILTERVAKLYHDIGRAMLASGNYDISEVEVPAKTSLEIREQIWEDASYYLAMSRSLLGKIYATYQMPEYTARAKKLLEQAVNVYSRVLGPEHEDTKEIVKLVTELKNRNQQGGEQHAK